MSGLSNFCSSLNLLTITVEELQLVVSTVVGLFSRLLHAKREAGVQTNAENTVRLAGVQISTAGHQ